MVVLVYINDPKVIEKILVHLKLPAKSPFFEPARRPEQVEMWEDDIESDAPERSATPAARGRGPPRNSVDEEMMENSYTSEKDDWAA